MRSIYIYDYDAERIEQKAEELDITIAEVVEQLCDCSIDEVE